MDWNYFVENDKFRPRRLPPTKHSVRIKDTTDMSSLRDYIDNSMSVEQAIHVYKACFDDSYMYEIELESFEECINRNGNRFLGDLGKLKGNIDLLLRLLNWDDEFDENEWLYVGELLGKQMAKHGIVKSKGTCDDDDWIEFLKSQHTAIELIALGEKHSLSLKGSKTKLAKVLLSAIQDGIIRHDKPYGIRPGKHLNEWFQALQQKYVNEIKSEMEAFPYPFHYIATVWNEVIIENSEYETLTTSVRSNHSTYLTNKSDRIELNNSSLPELLGTTIVSGNHSDSSVRTPKEHPNEEIGTTLEFDYRSSVEDESERRVRVRTVWSRGDAIYMSGHCSLRDSERTFKLSRVTSEIINVESGEVIDPKLITSVQSLKLFLSDEGIPNQHTKDDRKPMGKLSNFWKLILVLIIAYVLRLYIN
ncbi:MAG: hypothetical protein NPIRA05_01260 [Nitrospirales bacterium]|nr:MAG: hypothetical protein NPIRA05_01260 [Nitrospirales bacterium]